MVQSDWHIKFTIMKGNFPSQIHLDKAFAIAYGLAWKKKKHT